jgi:hypothetical protein
MAVPLTLVSQLVSGLMAGPVGKIIDGYVADVELRRKLKAELEGNLLSHLGQSLALQQAVVLAEINSEHWLTRSWRPLLMLLLMGFLVLVGLGLPLADVMLGHAVPFNPRWQSLPEGFWDFLNIGMGGYVGGRTLEKIFTRLSTTGVVAGGVAAATRLGKALKR